MIFKWHFKWHISNWPSIIYVLPHLFGYAHNLIFMIEHKNQWNIQKILVWYPGCHVFYTLNLCRVSFKQVLFFQFFILKIILSKQCNKSDCSTFSWSRMTGRKIRNRISKQNIYPIGWAAQKIFMGESRSIKYLLIELLMIFHNVQLYLAKGQHHISL